MSACPGALRPARRVLVLLVVVAFVLVGITIVLSGSPAGGTQVTLANPSLEDATNDVPTCWEENGWGSNRATFARTNDAHTGSWAERVDMSWYRSGAQRLIVDTGGCAPAAVVGQSYELDGWYKSSGKLAWVVLYQSRSTGQWLYWLTGPMLQKRSRWTSTSYTTPAVPADAAKLTFGLSLQSLGSVTVDDFSLAALSPAGGSPSPAPTSPTPSTPSSATATSSTATSASPTPTTSAPTSPSSTSPVPTSSAHSTPASSSSSSSSPAPSSSTSSPSPTGSTWYVSRSGNDSSGQSWATAWNELDQINWSLVKPGDTVLLDGGATACASPYAFSGSRPGVSCGMEYRTTLTVGASGTSAKPITIALAAASGHDGTAVFFGGRATPLPYCHQPVSSYTYTAGLADGIVIPGRSYVVIDGGHRSGIDVYGARQGIRFSSDSDNHITVSNTEVFDNGTASTSSNGWRTDAEGFSLRGSYLTFDRNIVHDNGQDEFQSEDVAAGTMHDLTWTNDWMYARRENPLYPGEPFNDLQRVGISDCTHADGIQLYSGGAQSGLIVDHSVFGPMLNQGFYPGDSGTGTSFSNVSITNSLFADTESHNIISDLDVSNWTLDHLTIFATQGGFETPDRGGMTLTNSIKYGGYVYAPGLPNSATSGTIWYSGDSVPGAANMNPQFAGPVPAGTMPGYDAIAAADFTPRCSGCAGKGSPITSIGALLTRIDGLDAAGN